MSFFYGIPIQTFLPSFHEIIHRLCNGLSLLEVVGEGLVEIRQSVMKQILHDFSNLFMDVLAFLIEQAIVDDFLREGMLEDVFQIRLKGSCPDEIQSLQTHQAPVDILFELRNTIENLI